jgi:hypothetical protein
MSEPTATPTPEQIEAYRDFLLKRSDERARGIGPRVTLSDRPKPKRGPQGQIYFNASKKRWSARINGKDCLFKTEAEAKAAIIAAIPKPEAYQSKFIPPLPPEPVRPEQPDPEDDDRFIEERTGEYDKDTPGDETCDPEEYQGSDYERPEIYYDPL